MIKPQKLNKITLIVVLIFSFSIQLLAQSASGKRLLKGVYVQWGYNREWYTKSTIHFKGAVNGISHDFKLYRLAGHDRSDLASIPKRPLDITIPQFSYRLGFYLNQQHTKAIEINFDHSKYIAADNQRVHAKGFIGSQQFDKDTSFTRDQVHLEHTNGANFYHFNYVRQYTVASRSNHQPVVTLLWKAGAGFMIPKTDVTLFGKSLDNRFHLAGYCLGAEGGARWYFSKKFFLEGTAKTGFVNYTNALTVEGGKAQHSFGYVELIGTLGYDINF
jgi:hypothetical protein